MQHSLIRAHAVGACIAGLSFASVACAMAAEEAQIRDGGRPGHVIVIQSRPISQPKKKKSVPITPKPYAEVVLRPPIFAERNLVGARSAATAAGVGSDVGEERRRKRTRRRGSKPGYGATRRGWSDAWMKRMLTGQ